MVFVTCSCFFNLDLSGLEQAGGLGLLIFRFWKPGEECQDSNQCWRESPTTHFCNLCCPGPQQASSRDISHRTHHFLERTPPRHEHNLRVLLGLHLSCCAMCYFLEEESQAGKSSACTHYALDSRHALELRLLSEELS